MKEFGRSRGKDEFDVYMDGLCRIVAGMARCEDQGCGGGIVSSYAGELLSVPTVRQVVCAYKHWSG